MFPITFLFLLIAMPRALMVAAGICVLYIVLQVSTAMMLKSTVAVCQLLKREGEIVQAPPCRDNNVVPFQGSRDDNVIPFRR